MNAPPTAEIYRTITIDEAVAEVSTPYQRYMYLVADLQRDRNSGGKHNYYAHPRSTTYDVAIARCNSEISTLENELKNGEKLIEKFSKDITNSRLDISDSNFKKLGRGEVEARQSAIAQAMDENFANQNLLETYRDTLKEHIWNQHVERVYNTTMRTIRNRFMAGSTVDWALRAITWINAYANKLRGAELVEDWPADYVDTSAW